MYITDKLEPTAKAQLESIAERLWRHGFNLEVRPRYSYVPDCQTCGKPCRARRNKFCGSECYRIFRTGKPHPFGGKPQLDERVCLTCGEKYHPRSHRSKFCDRRCYYQFKGKESS